MAEGEVSVLIGGKAGEGISSAGQVIAQLLGQLGYQVYMYFDYPSLIKGGHNFAIIRGAPRKVGAVRSGVDILLALDQETLHLHEGRLNDRGVVVFNSDTAKHPSGVGVPIRSILAAEEAPAVMGNSAILGAFARAVGMEWHLAERVFTKYFRKGTDRNLRIARRAYDASEERLRIPAAGTPGLPALTGNEAMGIGLVEAGLGVYLSYPMSPTSNLMHFLAGSSEDAGIRVIQPESEIAVILMALGCAYAGTRAAVGTSGGGFSLMVEALGLAGMAELPAVIVLGQRAGPSTGLATYTAQADLGFAIHAGHGEFPRLVLAPGDAGEARTWIRAAMDLAWRYQLPAIFLPDRVICEGMYSLDPSVNMEYRADPVLAGSGDHPYLRYALTGSGISPLCFPPAKGEVIRVNSHAHDTDGITTEDPGTTRAMADKRGRKMLGLAKEIEGMHPVNVLGDPDAATGILCWGSNRGACAELGESLGLRVIQPVALWPFPEGSFARAMKGVDRFFGVETNETGQLARLVREFGYRADGLVLKYDGRPFTVDELEQELGKVLA
ncbi:MAG: 2-oxoacid:acceptor oxidoreductase subunit alpha [Methanomicrobiales archaeon]|nr:2-oxoacid:acceptor oxidoreductase subunit alpha [Methanomicrobiales archaeon]MDD1669133.1 2-oxoacid:acceptor oxidoreductase subunit alpha [Methanomicrobiales archaeon]